jgi:hypothetical protein
MLLVADISSQKWYPELDSGLNLQVVINRPFARHLFDQSAVFMHIHAARLTIARLLLVGISLSVCFGVGCVQRRLMVRSQPEGALVTIDNHAVGRTPVKVPFVYYGTRQIQLEKEGFKTVRVKERIRTPWYEKFPLSFFSNNFALREIRDERLLDFELEPKSQVEENLLLDRANELRLNTQRETLTCPPSAPFN